MTTKEAVCNTSQLSVKKIILSIFFLLVLCRTAGAQDAKKRILSAADAGTCTADSTACSFLAVPSGSGGVTFTITANASANTVQFEATGDTEPTGSHTWVALSVFPSNATTSVTSTTSTGTWQANIAGFTQVRLRMSTFVGGTTTTYINLSTASARAGGGGGAGLPAGGLTGQSLTAVNGGSSVWASPGVPGRTTASATDTILCDSGTALRDRASTVEYTAAAVTVTVPDAGSSGCASNFVTEIIAGSGTTATVNRQTASTFTIYNGTSTVTSGATTFNLTAGQYAAITSRDNTNWIVRIVQATATPTLNAVLNPVADTTFTIPNANTVTFTEGTATQPIPFLIQDTAGNSGNGPTVTIYGRGGSIFNILDVVAFSTGGIAQFRNTSGANSKIDTNSRFVMRNDLVQGGVALGTATVGTSSTTDGLVVSPVAGATGKMLRVNNPGSTSTINYAVDSTGLMTNYSGLVTLGMGVPPILGVIHATANTAAISTATLCSSAATFCGVAGMYTVEWAFTETGTACATPGAGGVTFLLTWTDQNGTAHSAISLPMDDSASLIATSGTFTFRTTLGAAWGSGNFNISSNGSIIQYATGYTACGVGTGTYQLDISVSRRI